jgi:hypothetical protein
MSSSAMLLLPPFASPTSEGLVARRRAMMSSDKIEEHLRAVK